jgi:F-type H+-transporting ATPase subunit delta
MADFQAGKRYAQAVFSIASEQGTIAAWRQDLEDIAQVLAESDASALLADARRPVEQRQQLVERILDVQPLALNLAKLLVAKGRSLEARAVADAFKRLADEHEGIADAQVTSAVPHTPAEVTSLEQRLGTSLNARVNVTTQVDPSIVGGLVVRVGDRIIDGSIRTRLRVLRRELVGAR